MNQRVLPHRLQPRRGHQIARVPQVRLLGHQVQPRLPVALAHQQGPRHQLGLPQTIQAPARQAQPSNNNGHAV